MTKFKKRFLKMIYLNKMPHGTIAENEQFLKIIKNQKKFNKTMALFKSDYLRLFLNDKEKLNDIYFMAQFTSLKMAV